MPSRRRNIAGSVGRSIATSTGAVCLAFAFLQFAAGTTEAQVVTEFTAGITGGASPVGITAGPDGNLWFTEYNGNRIGRITPQGVVTEFSTGISAGARPNGIALGPDGNLWFTETGGNRIGRISPAGVVTEFSAGITGGASLTGITAGPDGNLWFTETSGNRIGRITPLGVVTEFSAGITASAAPIGITLGPDSNLWFTENNGNRIGRITPAGVVTEYGAGITANASPYGITAGPDGNLWFTETGGNRIGRFGLPAAISAVSRKMHGAAGTFDLSLSIVANNPTVEPRTGPTATIVITMDEAVTGADVAVTEGTATAGALSFSGNDVIVPLADVSDRQFVTVLLTNISSATHTGRSASIRLGFLVGDVNQTRVVSVADLALVNAELTQLVTAANYLKDVNVSGTLTLADKGVTNANLSQALPAP
jgi:streptogramin lyase